MKRFVYSFLFILLVFKGIAQEVKPYGYFLQDTMELAEPVQFSLSVSYPSDLTLLFPDSSFNYAPFEFRSKRFFNTESDSLISKDSVIYTLASFEIQNIQKLRLPVFIAKSGKQIPVYSQTDSLIFTEKIHQAVDSLVAIGEAKPVQVKKEFNYPYFIIGSVILAVLIVIILVVFGQRIVLYFRLFQIERKQKKFVAQFNLSAHLNSREEIQKYLKMWKNHLQYLTKRPYARFTTKEIHQLLKDDKLNNHLRSIDRIIYSSKAKTEEIEEAFNFLKEFSISIYQKRINQLKQNAGN